MIAAGGREQRRQMKAAGMDAATEPWRLQLLPGQILPTQRAGRLLWAGLRAESTGPVWQRGQSPTVFSAVSFHLRITAAVYVADSVLSMQHALSHPVTALPSGVGTIIVLSLHIRQLRLRDIKSLAYGHTARKWPGNRVCRNVI